MLAKITGSTRRRPKLEGVKRLLLIKTSLPERSIIMPGSEVRGSAIVKILPAGSRPHRGGYDVRFGDRPDDAMKPTAANPESS
jgi:hypothetical protein